MRLGNRTLPRRCHLFGIFGPIVLVIAVLASLVTARGADVVLGTEYQIKAAFLFNFAKFVDWPATAFQSPNSSIIVGVFGDDPFGNDLELTLAEKKINERGFLIKRFSDLKQLEYCHILFISRSEKKRIAPILSTVAKKPTLTVADEIERFCPQGGMINFVMSGKKVRFEISNPSAQQASLKISSKLLRLAAGEEKNPVKN